MAQITEDIDVLSPTTPELALAVVADSAILDLSAVEDYSKILEAHALAYKPIDYSFQVGEMAKVQGWILHVSVVRTQIPAVLDKLIPLLGNTPFRVVQHKEIARSLLDANQGSSMVGKVMSIFPDTDSEAMELAKILIAATRGFEGPNILTDIHLGGRIYTGYGGFNPVFRPDASGKQRPYIFDKNGALVEDLARIPFRLPEGIDWPFISLASPVVPPAKKLIKGKYLPIKLMKADCKGDVHKGLYVNSRLGIHWCVIKQGKRQMWADELGRDMRDRLAWQRELYQRLGDVVPMPRIIELFEENGDAYLVQEYVPSRSLMDQIYSLNKSCHSWYSWSPAEKTVVLDYLLQVLDMVGHMHRRNIVHRDLTPVNFLVRANGKLVLIDSELSYDLGATAPYLPYIAGTGGFMSPEQVAAETPTVKEDIYALGAFMLTILTGLAPLTVGTADLPQLRKNLIYFLGNEEMARLIICCLSGDPASRPDLRTVADTVKEYRAKATTAETGLNSTGGMRPVDPMELRETIGAGIRGLVEEPIPLLDGLWLSRNTGNGDFPGKQKNVFGRSGGLYEGITGVLYFLARAKEAGFDISACQSSYRKGWAFIREAYLDRLGDAPPGLYGGAAGIALAMATGMRAELLEDSPSARACLADCLSLPNKMPDVAAGVAGQGIAVLQCRKYLKKNVYQALLKGHVGHLLNSRYRGKYWVFRKNRLGRPQSAIGYSNGNTGITWFLLAYNADANDPNVHQVLLESLQLLKEEAQRLIHHVGQYGVRGLISGNIKILDGMQGLVLVFTKAYEVLKDTVYKDWVTKLLSLYPPNLVHDNLYQDIGLSGIGELYLEVYRVFQDPVFKEKADWLMWYFLAIRHKETDGRCHWIGNNTDFPTADLLTGNTGILHFLLRSLLDNSVGYRLLG